MGKIVQMTPLQQKPTSPTWQIECHSRSWLLLALVLGQILEPNQGHRILKTPAFYFINTIFSG
jgi:hypothetical protein